MKRPAISAIITCFNGGSYITEAVNSVLQQPSRYHCETIVVDDASTDPATKQSLEALEQIDNVTVIRQTENQGVQHARNTGLRAANNDYIITIDGDDRLSLDPEVLQKGTYTDRAIDILSANSDVAFVHPLTRMFGKFEGETISAYPITEARILAKHHVPTWIVYRKEDAFDAGLHNEDIVKWQDWSFGVALLNARFLKGKSNDIKFLNESYYSYRVDENPDRISLKPVDEKEMVRKTVGLYPENFRNHYPDMLDSDIVATVYASKPSRLKDWFHTAYDSPVRALSMARQRVPRLLRSEAIMQQIP